MSDCCLHILAFHQPTTVGEVQLTIMNKYSLKF